MKYTILALFIIILLSSCKNEQFVISGVIENAENKTLKLLRLDLNGETHVDSVKLKGNGNFKFKQKRLEIPTFYRLAITDTKYITILGDSIENIEIKADYNTFIKDYEVKNSQSSIQLKEINVRLQKLQNNIDSLFSYYNNLTIDEKHKQIDKINVDLSNHISVYKKETGKFILENPKSFLGYYALFLTLSDGTQIMDVLNREDQIYFSALATSLNVYYPESQRVKQLYNIVLSAKAEERRLRILDIIHNAEGSDMPDLKIEDQYGEIQSLNELRGKVVLLSFWASWDDASVKENDVLKNIYKKYSPKGFEVYQIGLERSKVLWENSILINKYPWISVTELKYVDSPAARMYNIKQIPANYLIDRDGEIIGKNLFGRRLDEKLKEVL